MAFVWFLRSVESVVNQCKIHITHTRLHRDTRFKTIHPHPPTFFLWFAISLVLTSSTSTQSTLSPYPNHSFCTIQHQYPNHITSSPLVTAKDNVSLLLVRRNRTKVGASNVSSILLPYRHTHTYAISCRHEVPMP